MKIGAYSHSRFRAGAAAKRAYGSSTGTVFVVFDEHDPAKRSLYVESYGATSGERAANAKRVAAPYFKGEVEWPTRNDAIFGKIKAYPAK